MNGYKIRFNGLDRLYSRYKTEFDGIAQKSWQLGQAILGEETRKLEDNIAKKYSRQYAVAVGSATDGLYLALRAAGIGPEHKVFCPVSLIPLLLPVNFMIFSAASPKLVALPAVILNI